MDEKAKAKAAMIFLMPTISIERNSNSLGKEKVNILSFKEKQYDKLQ